MSPPARDGAGPRDIIHIVDDNLRKGFAQVPRPVLRAKGLSVKAKLVYVLLLDYAWQDDSCFPGQDTMATDLDVSTDTVQRALKELRAYQLVDWKQLGLNRPNVYYILRLSDCPHLDLAGNRKLRLPETAPLRHPETANSGTNNTHETIPTPSKPAAQSLSLFTVGVDSKFRKGSPSKVDEENIVQQSRTIPPVPKLTEPERPHPTTPPVAASDVSETGLTRLSQVLATHGIPANRGREPVRTEASRTHQEPIRQAAAPRRRGTASSVAKADQDTIRIYLTQYAEEFHDQAPKFSSTMTRVLHYFETSGALLGPFTARMEAARRRTKADQSAGRIRKKGSPFAYFLSLLEEELGLREAPASFTHQAAATPSDPEPARRKSLAGKYARMVHR